MTIAHATRIGPLLLLPGILAACAYAQPGRGTPSAELVIRPNLREDPFLVQSGSNENRFYGFADGACELPLGALAVFMYSAAPEVVRVAAGKRIYIRADWLNLSPAAIDQSGRRTCHNLVSFVPEAGERYEIRQEITQRYDAFAITPACLVDVRNVKELEPPQSLEEHAFTGKCAKLIRNA
jgi:hypothetical protein